MVDIDYVYYLIYSSTKEGDDRKAMSHPCWCEGEEAETQAACNEINEQFRKDDVAIVVTWEDIRKKRNKRSNRVKRKTI